MEECVGFFCRFGIVTSEYAIHLYILICIYLILAQSFNFSFGLGFLFNLAHVAAYAVGAYTAALLSTGGYWTYFSELMEFWGQWLPISYLERWLSLSSVCGYRGAVEAGCLSPNVPFLYVLPASMLVAACLALPIGAIATRLTQDYFAIGTLTFSAIVSALLINWKSLTRGVLGIPGIPRPDLRQFGIEESVFNQNLNFLILIGATVVLVEIVFYLLFRSPLARSLRAQAEAEHVALALGKPTGLVRNLSFLISSAFAGLAGAFFAYYINYIDPTSFALNEMIFVVTIVVLGRPGSYWGCLLAAAFLVLLPEPLRFVHLSPSILGPMRQLLYAVILFAVVFINRSKLFPVERKV